MDSTLKDSDNISSTSSISMPKWILAGFLVIILLVIFYNEAHKRIDTLIKRDMEDTLRAVLLITEETLDLWIHDREDDARHLSNRPDIVPLIGGLLKVNAEKETLVKNNELRKLRQLLAPYLKEQGDLGFFIVNEEFINIGSMRDENLGEINLLKDHGTYLDDIFYGKSVVVLPLRSDVMLPANDGKLRYEEPTMFHGVPVWSNGEIIAAFLVRIDPKLDFSRIVSIPRFGKTADPYVVDKEGRMLTETRFRGDAVRIGLVKETETSVLNIQVKDPGCNMVEGCTPKLKRIDQPFTLMAESLLRGEKASNVDGYNDYRGVPVVGAWKWSDHHDFGLVIEQDVSEAYEKFNTIRNIFISSFVFITTLFSLYAFSAIKNNRELLGEIAERKRLEGRLTTLATTDSLTGAFNRVKFDSMIDNEVARADRFEHGLSLLIIDIDYFKKVNDTYGHLKGDEVLQEIALIGENTIRATDSFVRWGGEEFLVLAVETYIDEAMGLAERLRKRISENDFDIPQKVTISIGVGSYKKGETVDEFIKRTDDALYKAKDGGRNMVVKAVDNT